MSKFRYETLLKGQIRLLKLDSSESTRDISIHIRHFDFDDAPEYTALSYTWGSEIDGSRTISIDDYEMVVWINLYHALCRLRRELTDEAWLWIDAICIDQSNPDDKAMQIPIMGKIYENAALVAVWLGMADKDEEDALERTEDLAEAIGRIQSGDIWKQIEAVRAHFPPPNDAFWDALWRVLLKPWFNRIWIIQEISLCPEIVLLLGEDARVDYLALMDVVGSMKRIHYHDRSFVGRPDTWMSNASLRKEIKSRLVSHQDILPEALEDPDAVSSVFCEQSLGLLEKIHVLNAISNFMQDEHPDTLASYDEHLHTLFQVFSGRGCTLDQDRVFAMFGVMPERMQGRLHIHPKLDSEEVFMRISSFWLTTDPHLNFLQWVKPRSKDVVAMLPSWCLDFRHMSGTSIVLFGWSQVSHKCNFEAGTNPVNKRDDVEGNVASIDGTDAIFRAAHADTVMEQIACPRLSRIQWQNMLNEQPREDHVIEALRWIDACEQLAGKTNKTGNNFEALWRTLTLNTQGIGPDTDGGTDREFREDRGPSYKGVVEALRQRRFSGIKNKTASDLRTYFDHLSQLTDMDFFLTAQGRLGRSEHFCQPGDEIVVISGARTPFLMRPATDGRYEFRGEVFVHGIMYGEAFEAETGASSKRKIYRVK